MTFQLNERAVEIRWSNGSCGVSGCTDSECVCALCAQPIGIPESDPRWDGHDDYCGDCELCQDEVPIILFRGEGEAMMQAAFHQRCFEKLLARGEGFQQNPSATPSATTGKPAPGNKTKQGT